MGRYAKWRVNFLSLVTSNGALMRDNQEVYSTLEFDPWVDRQGLNSDEHFLITRYLDPARRTLEAGTGGGRILFEMQKLSFSDLHGFDFVPAFIEACRRRDTAGQIRFDVRDATQLDYESDSFDQILYLQQIVCLLEGPEARVKTVREAHRILKPGGTALFSFLSYEVRSRQPMYAAMLAWLRMVRWMRRSDHTLQTLPWLKLGGNFNWKALRDEPPYVYWYRAEEAGRLLADNGFQIVGIGSTRQIETGRLPGSATELAGQPLRGTLYAVCTKAASRPREAE